MPGRPVRKSNRLVVVVPVVALGVAAAVWWLHRGPRAVSDKEGKASAAAVVARTPDPRGYVALRAGREDGNTFGELVQAYGAWASRPDALEARKMIVKALLGHPDIRVGLEALMAAVQSDQTPKALDPMWPTLVEELSSHWDAVTFPFARDQVAIEERPKPKDLMLDSMTAVHPEKLADSQKPLLASDLIDMYPGLRPDQRPSVEKQLAALAGNDIVEILHGKGLTEGSTDLQIVVDKQRAVQAVLKHPVPDKPAEE
jgi:hypothetical protein